LFSVSPVTYVLHNTAATHRHAMPRPSDAGGHLGAKLERLAAEGDPGKYALPTPMVQGGLSKVQRH
jgi:hypothetical protein